MCLYLALACCISEKAATICAGSCQAFSEKMDGADGRSSHRGGHLFSAPKSRKGACTANIRCKACPANIAATSKFRRPNLVWRQLQIKLELNSSSGYSNKSSLPQIHITMVSRPLAFIGAAVLILGVAVASSSIEHDVAADAGLRRRRLGATISADRMVHQVRASRVCISGADCCWIDGAIRYITHVLSLCQLHLLSINAHMYIC